MIFHHLHHKMAIYKDCTLSEILIVAIINLVILTLIFSVLMQILFHLMWLGYLLAAIAIVPVTRVTLSRLQKIKFAKPYGYYQHRLLKQLQQTPLNHWLLLPFVIRVGKWGVRRP